MATPRTLVIPPQASSRGGALLTSLDNQGVAAVEQQILLGVLGPGRSSNPWLQREQSLAAAIFQEAGQATLDLELRVRSVMARLEAQELARLLGLRVLAVPDGEGRATVEVRWQPLRLSSDRRPEIVTRVGES
jgi:acyl-coenzyme A thioesterase PaaI-like protein